MVFLLFLELKLHVSIIIFFFIFSLRFVFAYKCGVVEFCTLRTKTSGHQRVNSLPNSERTKYIEVCRSIKLFNQSILYMELAHEKIYVASKQGHLKVSEF